MASVYDPSQANPTDPCLASNQALVAGVVAQDLNPDLVRRVVARAKLEVSDPIEAVEYALDLLVRIPFTPLRADAAIFMILSFIWYPSINSPHHLLIDISLCPFVPSELPSTASLNLRRT
jgi:hypothetical protein